MLKRMTMVALLVGLVGFAYATSAIAADKPVRLVGKLAKIAGKTLTIASTADDGSENTVVTCNEETRIGRDGEKSAVKFKDLKVGQTVRTYYTTSDKIAKAVIIAKPGSK